MSLQERTVVQMHGDPAFARSVRDCLTTRGIDVILARDPAALIAELITERQRVVLLDLDFPDVDGVELLREIKRNDGCTQVIVLTAGTAMSTAIQSFRCGAEACFLKPTATLEPLVGAVEDAFRKMDRWWECLRDITRRKQAQATALLGGNAETQTEDARKAANNGQKRFVEKRRQWTRYRTGGKEVAVLVDGRRQRAMVVDESFGGIGLLMDNHAQALLDREITVVSQGVLVQGLVRWVQPDEEGGCRMGIEWLRSGGRSDASHELEQQESQEPATQAIRDGACSASRS
jgi:DNA-binding response OmpR family regulator